MLFGPKVQPLAIPHLIFSTPLFLHKLTVDTEPSLCPYICCLYLSTPPYMGEINAFCFFLNILTTSTTATILN